MAGKKENIYFEAFEQGVHYACEAASMLQKDLEHYEPDALAQSMNEMHKLEHAADLAKHDMVEKLLKEFITPIEREDIIGLAGAIDDVTDSIEDVLLRLYMFNIRVLRPDAIEFARVVSDCCTALEDMIAEFANFHKSKTIKGKIIEINHLEEVGDKLYTEAMHRLHSEGLDGVEILSWTTLYDRFEKCCDKCEDVADLVELVILKNS